ncbi:MAG TPA: hypothetical protein VFI31_19620, partial [Pirellulales bacterium]|nr:hypothetical protein [Pirellulales bacterium]
MPDPLRCLLAVVLTAGASAVVALALGRWKLPVGWAEVISLAAGLAVGSVVLRLPLVWPPINGLGRLLTIVVPAALVVELIASWSWARRRAWCLRFVLAMGAGPVLLRGSVYLSGVSPEWPPWQAALVLTLSGVLLFAEWVLLTKLSRRSGGISVSLSVAAAVLCGGVAVMFAGYVAGGLAALPLSVALCGCVVMSGWLNGGDDLCEGILTIGVVGLFGLLYVGRFFGQLSTERAVVLFLAPLAGWLVELPLFRRQLTWRIALCRLVLVGIPLAIVLLFAKRDFDRDMRPLLGRSHDATTQVSRVGPASLRAPAHRERRQASGIRKNRLT